MSLKYLNLSGLEDLWINIKNYILSKVPTKTSELTNDSGYLTSHQSLDNYVTLNTGQTITAIKTITGGNQGKMLFKNPNYTKGDAVESGITISRIYFGNGASYGTANGVLTTDINSAGNTSMELCAINNTASNSNRASLILTYDKSASRPRTLKSWGDFIPYSDNNYTLGNPSNIWKECYSNVYYLGSTAFGDIVTHNASEFLTSHQSLSNYVTLDGTQTIAGTKTFSSTISGSISGNAGTATQFSANTTVALTGDATGTSAGSKKGWSVPVTLANSGVTAGTYGPSADVTGNNNATISVPEITVDAKGRVTSVTNRTLTCKNNTYNVYNKTLTIQKNGTNVATFTSNSNTDVTANITVPTKVSELTNDSGYLTSHQSLSNYVTLNTAQEITNAKTFKDANTVVKRTDIEAGNTLPSADKLARNIFQDKNGKELGSIYYYKNSSGNTGLCLRAGDWFSESEGVYSLNASGTNRRAELVLYTNSSGDCCIQPNGLFSTHIKPLNSSVYLGDSTKPFGRVYANSFQFCNPGLLANTDVQTTEEHSFGFFGKNNTPLSYITFQKRPNLKDRIAIRINTTSSSYKSYDFDATCFYPESSNSVDIGSTTNIFKNIYCNNYYKGTTAFGDIVTHNASEFLTEHPSITLSTNTTSTASPAHGGTFTCIDSVTQDTNGHITKVNTKTVTLPSDNNTDTKVTQTVTTANSGYPVLLCATANAAKTETTTSRFSEGLTVNARYSSIYMTNKYDTANTKGVRDSTKGYLNGDIIFRCYDASEMGRIHCESSKNGYQQTYMQARSYIKNGAISPEGTATTCYITVRVRDNGSKTIYTDGSWENSLTPYANNTYSLGTSTNKWKSFNGLEPSSLSLPNPSNSIDISAYFTHTKTGETNVCTVPSNGWIFLYLATVSSCEVKVLDAAQNVLWGTSVYSFRAMLMIPVVTGSTLQTQWTTEYSTVTVLTAKFYPCQGNV